MECGSGLFWLVHDYKGSTRNIEPSTVSAASGPCLVDHMSFAVDYADAGASVGVRRDTPIGRSWRGIFGRGAAVDE